ncbi:hypothetical protein [Alienimonas sp. DA493]|uniref:hypothetical protein n=1 Tax=Alienimonas sp. DA493 TaxID=3373605 RepID=UPI0037541F79
MAFAAAFAVFPVPFLRRLPSATRWGMVALGGLFLIGAVGWETVAGQHGEGRSRNVQGALLTAVAESFEMAGAILFVVV